MEDKWAFRNPSFIALGETGRQSLTIFINFGIHINEEIFSETKGSKINKLKGILPLVIVKVKKRTCCKIIKRNDGSRKISEISTRLINNLKKKRKKKKKRRKYKECC